MGNPMYNEPAGVYQGVGIKGRMIYDGWVRRLLRRDHPYRKATGRPT